MEELKSELEEWLARQELLWKQRSKAYWLQEGDRNTTFFHARANERRRRNSIKALKTEEGALTSDCKEIQQIILKHFMQIYGSIRPE
ncbi:UNVERIFIED_CONTAM: hypothetical protein Slati_1683200 [Sesamum latifolium]|uniref:Uncharacterized protein n=1 Tax=Sesamum latifolium TaxID=2727402 RepID=A0AAW2WVT8_9LAMI